MDPRGALLHLVSVLFQSPHDAFEHLELRLFHLPPMSDFWLHDYQMHQQCCQQVMHPPLVQLVQRLCHDVDDEELMEMTETQRVLLAQRLCSVTL